MEDVTHIQFGIDTPFWREFMLPRIQSQCKINMRALATGKTDTDDIKRGWFQALEWVMNLPIQAINEARNEAIVQERETAVNDIDEFRARSGFRSPYPAPKPGELTADENEDSNA